MDDPSLPPPPAFWLPDRRSRYFLLFNFPCMHYFPLFGSKLKPSRKDAKTSPVIPSLPSLLDFPSTPRKMFLLRRNSNSSSFQSWNIWIQIFEILNSKYRGGKWGEKKIDANIRVYASKYLIEGEKSNSNSSFPIYICIWTVDKFSLLSSRKEDRRIGNQTNCTYRSDICGVQAQLWRKAIIWDWN